MDDDSTDFMGSFQGYRVVIHVSTLKVNGYSLAKLVQLSVRGDKWSEHCRSVCRHGSGHFKRFCSPGPIHYIHPVRTSVCGLVQILNNFSLAKVGFLEQN